MLITASKILAVPQTKGAEETQTTVEKDHLPYTIPLQATGSVYLGSATRTLEKQWVVFLLHIRW